MKHLVRGHVREDEAHDLRRVEVLGHLDRVLLRHADALRVGAPHRQRADTVSLSQPRAARAELLDDADELVAGRERRLRAAEIRAGADQRIGERHAGGQNPDADLARTRSGIVLLHHPQDLGPAEVIDDDALHGRVLRGRTVRASDQSRGFDPYKTAFALLSHGGVIPHHRRARVEAAWKQQTAAERSSNLRQIARRAS